MAVTFGLMAGFIGLDVPESSAGWLLLLFIALVPGALTMTLFSYSVPRLGASSFAILANAELVAGRDPGARRSLHRRPRDRRGADRRGHPRARAVARRGAGSSKTLTRLRASPGGTLSRGAGEGLFLTLSRTAGEGGPLAMAGGG